MHKLVGRRELADTKSTVMPNSESMFKCIVEMVGVVEFSFCFLDQFKLLQFPKVILVYLS